MVGVEVGVAVGVEVGVEVGGEVFRWGWGYPMLYFSIWEEK